MRSISILRQPLFGAGGGTRTHTGFTPTDFESVTSTIPSHRHTRVVYNKSQENSRHLFTLRGACGFILRIGQLTGNKLHIHIGGTFDSGHVAGKAVLPEIEPVIEIGEGIGQCSPELIVCQTREVKLIIPEMAVEVHAGVIAGILQSLAEGDGAVCEDGTVHPVSSHRRIALYLLPVVDNGHVDVIVFERVDNVLRLLKGLLYTERLREKVHAHVDVAFSRGGDVFVKIGVGEQPALGKAPVAETHEGKVHARGLDERPVDIPLMFGHIHTVANVVFRPDIGGPSAAK